MKKGLTQILHLLCVIIGSTLIAWAFGLTSLLYIVCQDKPGAFRCYQPVMYFILGIILLMYGLSVSYFSLI
jgi:hypothetical protein